MQLIKALSNKKLKFLLFSQTISDLGDWMVIPIFAALVSYEWQLGTFELTLIALFMALPSIILGPFIPIIENKC